MSTKRDLVVKKERKLSEFLLQWEMILIYIFIAVNIMLIVARPDLYFKAGTISSMIQSGLDICPLVLGMSLVMILGDVDVSCSATMIFSAMVTGLLMDAGAPAVIAVGAALIVGMGLGAINGYIIAYLGLPAVITTISTSLLFRGTVRIILDVNVLKNFPGFYARIAWDNICGIPVSMILYLMLAAIFVVLLQKTSFGRSLYMIGNNSVTALYSGINVKKIKFLVFVLMGLMSAITSIFYIGRMGGGASSSMGSGSEMTAIAIVALGGVAAEGGSGKIYGPVIATFIITALTYFLGLLGMDDNGKSVFTGIILIISVVLTNIKVNRTSGNK